MRARVGTAMIVLAGFGCAAGTGPANVARVNIESYGTVYVGGTLEMSASVTDEAGNVLPGRTVAWHSSDEAAATVSPTGLVQGVGESGSVTITATCEGVTGTTRIESWIDLRGAWRGSTPDGYTHRFTLTSNTPCPGAACAGYGGWNAPGAGASYTLSFGSRNPRSVSFELSNATDHFTFRGYYSDGSTISGTINNFPVVLTRMPIGFAGDHPRGYSAVPSSAARLAP